MALGDIYQKASLVQIPSGYKAADAELYSVVPNTTAGDFTVSVAAGATRVNKDGLVESVAANQARLNYDPSNPQDPHLLLEPQRTNDTTHSEDFTQTSYWNNVIDVVATTNQTTAPDGSNTGNKIQANSGTNFKILRKGAFTIPSGITMSMFVKRGNHDYILFKAQGDYNFNLNTLTWGGSYSNVGYELYPNDWVRLYATTSSSVLSYFGIYLTDSNFNQSWNATGNEFVYVWGAQMEAGTYATSYIPTTTAAVTRTADSNEIASGLENIIGQTEGTLFLDFEYLYETTSDSSTDALRDIFVVGSTTDLSENITFDNYRGLFRIYVNQDIGYLALGSGSAHPNTRYKLAIKYKTGDCKAYLNGSLLGSSTGAVSFATPLNGIFFSYNSSSRPFKNQKKVYQLMVFKEALTDAELITLTS